MPAETWILLRGLGRCSDHWGGFTSQIQRAWPSARIVPLDLAGNGARFRERSPACVELMVQDYRSQLEAMQVKPPYRLFALSLGGMVAIEWAHRWPEELERAVLVGASARPLSPFFKRLLAANYLSLLRLLIASDRIREQTVLRLTSNHAAPGTVDRWVAIHQHYPVSALNLLRQLIAAARYRLPQTRPEISALLMAGQCDRLVSATCSQELAGWWGRPVAIHPTAGHDVPLDDGTWVMQELGRWLEATAST
jgi:pimeloyl-ACP methyl ester carboxylesterase